MGLLPGTKQSYNIQWAVVMDRTYVFKIEIVEKHRISKYVAERKRLTQNSHLVVEWHPLTEPTRWCMVCWSTSYSAFPRHWSIALKNIKLLKKCVMHKLQSILSIQLSLFLRLKSLTIHVHMLRNMETYTGYFSCSDAEVGRGILLFAGALSPDYTCKSC